MNKKDNRKLISEMKDMLEDKKKLTLESIVFSENDESDFDGEDYSDEDFDMNDNVDDVPQSDNNSLNPSVQNDINNIRQICLKAITKLASNPDSAEYDLMKKMWNLCDKTIETKKENNV